MSVGSYLKLLRSVNYEQELFDVLNELMYDVS